MYLFTDGTAIACGLAQIALHCKAFTAPEARRWKTPVYMLRTAYNRREGEILQDKIWKATVERTGGRFYAISDENSLIRAIDDINRLSAGRVQLRQYAMKRPAFVPFALIAVMWNALAKPL